MNAKAAPALPAAYLLLRLLVVLNWLAGLAILVLLVVMPHERWIMGALDLAPSTEATRMIWGLRAIALVGLASIPINRFILRRLLAMVGTVREGDPFVAANAARLRAIGWALLTLQLLGMLVGAIARAIEDIRPIDIDGNWSLAGWAAVLLTFVLAGVFAEGARMRDELEGTI